MPIPISNEFHSKFIEDDEFDYFYWMHTHYIRNQSIIFYFGISRFGLEKILKLDIYRKHPFINFANIFSSR